MENSVEKTARKTNLWNRMNGPLKVGLAFAIIAIVMALVGLLKGSSTTPLTARSVLMAVLSSGGTWGLVSWAIASAASDSMVDLEE